MNARSHARVLWRSRWSILRLSLAAALVWVIAADTPARLARLQLSLLPNFDFVSEVASLRAQGRFGEAIMVGQSGLERAQGGARDALQRELDATKEEQSSLLRRLKDAGLGALSGRGDSLEGLIGAVTADFFVVGDVRDLVIQSLKLALDSDPDEVVMALSAVGVATTIAPEIDWAPSLLKAARKMGSLSEGLSRFVLKAVRTGKLEDLRPLLADTRTLTEKLSPGGALRALRLAEDPADAARLARFVERESHGPLALHVLGKDGTEFVKTAGDAAPAAEKLAVTCAAKGAAGRAFLRTPPARLLLKPHPLLGLAKAVWKGNATRLVERLVDRVDPHAWWLLPAAAAWALLEFGLIARNARRAEGNAAGRLRGAARNGRSSPTARDEHAIERAPMRESRRDTAA